MRSTTSNTITAILDWMDLRNVLGSRPKIYCRIKIHRRVIYKPAMMDAVLTLTSLLVCAIFPVFGKVPAKNQGLKTYPNHENQDLSFLYLSRYTIKQSYCLIPRHIFVNLDMSQWQRHY